MGITGIFPLIRKGEFLTKKFLMGIIPKWEYTNYKRGSPWENL